MMRRLFSMTPLIAAFATQVLAVELPLDVQRKLGLTTAVVSAERGPATASGFARVLDVVPLASLDADLAAAKAVASASTAEARRTHDLASADFAVSKRVAEAAAAQARADNLRLELLQRRLGLEWGPAFVTMGDARRSALISNLAAGRAALVRLDAPAGMTGVRQAIATRQGGRSARIQVLGQARLGDPRFQTPGLLGLVTGPEATDFATGLVFPITFSAGAQSGVLLPRSALLRAGGQTFVYVRKDATHFERRQLGQIQARSDGLLAMGAVRPGETVATSGAAALFAAETQSKGEDE